MRFGTDGFRGPIETDITPEFCLNLGYHTGKIILEKGYDSVIIGKDTRVSGYMLESALQAGFISSGIDVKLAGPIPTPAVSFLTATYAGQFGVVISASHNPYEDNGIKFFNRHGRKVTENLEHEIESRLNSPIKPVEASKLGKAFRIDSASGRYIEYCKSTLRGNHSFKNIKILVDGANGANYKITPMLLEELGAEVIRINCDPDGFNINVNSAVLDQSLFKKYAKEHTFDFCAAVDGDGDRLVLADADGDVFNGDDILYLLAKSNLQRNVNGCNAVVGTDMTNQGVADALSKHKIKLIRSQVGDKFISRELVEKDLILGAETSGHIIQRNYSESGDANIALIQVLTAIQESGVSLKEVSSEITKYAHNLESISVKDKTIIDKEENQKALNVVKEKFPSARINIRASGTENKIRIMVESKDNRQNAQVLNEIKSLIK